MKKVAQLTSPIVIALALVAFAGLATRKGSSPITSAAAPVAPPPQQALVNAHGSPGALAAIDRYTLSATRVRNLLGTAPFVLNIIVSIDGRMFIHSVSTDERSEEECYDGRGSFRAVARSLLTNGGEVEPLPSDAARRRAVESSNLMTTGLLPLLRKFVDPAAEVSRIAVDSNGERFSVRTPDGSFVVYTDPKHRIVRVDSGNHVSMQFAGFRSYGSLVLPSFQRISIDGRLVWDVYFRDIVLNPEFPEGHFDPARLGRQ